MNWQTLFTKNTKIKGIDNQAFSINLYGVASVSYTHLEAIELDVVAQSIDGKKLLVGECKWTEGEDAGRLIYELTAKARKLPFLKGQEIVPVLFLKQKPLRESDALVITPQEIIDAIG